MTPERSAKIDDLVNGVPDSYKGAIHLVARTYVIAENNIAGASENVLYSSEYMRGIKAALGILIFSYCEILDASFIESAQQALFIYWRERENGAVYERIGR